MRTSIHSTRRRRGLTALAVLGCAALIPVTNAQAGTGGMGTGSGGSGSGNCSKDAHIRNGKAVAPDCAPHKVKRVIAAANDIARGEGYCLGGGHQSWHSSCYDCSGAVSYALHGGDLLNRPRDSSGLARWGRGGRGDWITIYGNPGHAFMTVAGVRFDTSDTPGAGPGWSSSMGYENPREYTKRHRGGL